MKRLLVIVLTALVVFAVTPACKKSGGGACNEIKLVFTTNPALNTVQAPAPGPTFPVQVTITENLPSAGVAIRVTARPENSQTSFFSETRNSSTASNTFTVTNTPQNVASIVEVVVTSRGCNTNTSSGSYRYSRK